jgi:hypothetical protein
LFLAGDAENNPEWEDKDQGQQSASDTVCGLVLECRILSSDRHVGRLRAGCGGLYRRRGETGNIAVAGGIKENLL